MRRRVLLAGAASSAMAALPRQGRAARLGMPEAFEPPRPLPEFGFTDEAGREHGVADFPGQTLVINLWATWCPPCVAEMPTLDRLQAQLGGERFEVVALSVDRAGVGAVRRFFDEIGIRALRIFVDRSGKAARDLRIFGIPATLLIGPDGREMGRLVGPAEWDAPEMVAFFRTIIANSQRGN